MKAALKVFLRFVLASILVLLVVYLIFLVLGVASHEVVSEQDWLDLHLHCLTDTSRAAIPLGLAVMMFCLFGILHYDKGRLAARLVLLVLGAGLFMASFRIDVVLVAPSSQAPVRSALLSGTNYQAKDTFFRLDSLEQGAGVWVLSPGKDQRLGRDTVTYDSDRSQLTLKDRALVLDLAAVEGSTERLLAEDGIPGQAAAWTLPVRQFFDDLHLIAGVDWLSSVILAASLAWAMMSLWFWVRFSRWPLLNLFLTLFWVTALGFLLVLVRTAEIQALFQSLHPLAATWAVPLTCGVFGLVWILLYPVLPAFKDWKREVGP